MRERTPAVLRRLGEGIEPRISTVSWEPMGYNEETPTDSLEDIWSIHGDSGETALGLAFTADHACPGRRPKIWGMKRITASCCTTMFKCQKTRHGLVGFETTIYTEVLNVTCLFTTTCRIYDAPPGFRCLFTLTILRRGLAFLSLVLICFGPPTTLAHIGRLAPTNLPSGLNTSISGYSSSHSAI